VGEWHFYPIAGDPSRILDEHWCMSPYYTLRDDYYKKPTYPLKAINVTLQDYQEGPLENWTKGSLHFNGLDQYAVLSNADICRPVGLEAHGRNENVKRTVTGAELSNPQIHTSSFLIEVCFKTTPGLKDAILLRKMDQAGYALGIDDSGRASLIASAGGPAASIHSARSLNDGKWHHLIAEADRRSRSFAIYVDGQKESSSRFTGLESSLANEADLYVGGTPSGHYFNGAIDFLRIARGTLADSKTTIEELYQWEFAGPFLDDFDGHRRPPDGGCAGAIDAH
jgi:hypothetical protein